MKVEEVFGIENIVMIDHAESKQDCLKLIAKHACKIGVGSDEEALLKGFMERESECTTGFGGGFAIPHTRCDAVKKVGVIALKSKAGIAWEALDDQSVYIAIALLVPCDGSNIHMELLSSLSRKLINHEFKEMLLSGEGAITIHQTISDALEGK